MKLYLIVSVCFVVAYGSTPDYFPQCKRNDPEIEKCIIEGLEAMRPKLIAGIPEINLPPLDPFIMDVVYVNTSLTGASLKTTVKNIIARGGGDFEIDYLKMDLKNKYAGELKLTFPQLDVVADYHTKTSRVLFFKLSGNGKFKGFLTEVTVVAKCVASPIVKNHIEYLQLDSITTKVKIGSGDIEVIPADLSFPGRAASSFIKSSPSLILSILSPAIDETIAHLVKQYVNDVLAGVPLRNLLFD